MVTGKSRERGRQSQLDPQAHALPVPQQLGEFLVLFRSYNGRASVLRSLDSSQISSTAQSWIEIYRTILQCILLSKLFVAMHTPKAISCLFLVTILTYRSYTIVHCTSFKFQLNNFLEESSEEQSLGMMIFSSQKYRAVQTSN